MALGAAAAERERAYQLGGAEREAALIEAAGSFGAVADDDELAVAVRAEAAFRAGELLRARQLGEQAGVRFAQALRLGAALAVPPAGSGDDTQQRAQKGAEASVGSAAAASPEDSRDEVQELRRAREFAARGLLELAHLERREDHQDEALALYERLSIDFPDQPRQGAKGATWMIKLLLRQGRLEEAVAAVMTFADGHADLPLDLVHIGGAVAEALVEQEHDDAARALLDTLSEKLSPLMEADDSPVKSALAAVRVTVWGRDR